MENRDRKFFLAVLGVLLCVCLSSCMVPQLPDFTSPDKYSDSRQALRHHSIQKRPTVLLNRLMYALHNAITPSDDVISESRKSQMELERRGYPKHYVTAMRCYFNAVTCFRRKRRVSARSNNV